MSKDRRTYFCFDEGLSEELAPLIDAVEEFMDMSSSVSLGDSLQRENVQKEGGCERNGTAQKALEWQITPIYEGRNKLYRLQKGQYDLVVKCFALPSLFKQFYYGWGDNSKAKRSAQNSLYLEQLELGVAKARAFVEEHSSFGLLKRSYYISDRIDYTKCDIHSEMRGYSNPNGFLPALARFLVQLHELGVEHRDLSPGNILYKYDRATAQYDFSLVDVNRMQSYPYALSPQMSLKNMERLASNYSVSSQLAYYYAEARGWETDETIKKLNALCDNFWQKRLPKLTTRALKRHHSLSPWQTFKIYLRYKWCKLRRRLTQDKEQKAKFFQREEELYLQYLYIDDIRFVLRRKEGYSYRISKQN